MFLSAKTDRCILHAYQHLMLFVIITALYFGQTNAACLFNDNPCPRDRPYCTEVGCVFKCPDKYFANGSTCVWSCGDAITDLSQMGCAKTCPRPGMLIYSSVVTIGARLRHQRVCHESCAQLFESDKIKLFRYKNTCVRACPDDAIYISNNTCVEDCSVGNVTMITITAPDSNTTLGIECRLKRLCPNGTFSDQNNTGCFRECAGVLESGNCKDRCNQLMLIENGHCVEFCSPLHPIAKWKDESNGVSNYECVKDCGNTSYSYKNTCVVKGQCFYPVTLGGRKCSDTCPESHPYKIEDGCEKTCPLGYTLNKQSLQCESCTKDMTTPVIVSLLCLLYLIVFRSSLGDMWSVCTPTLKMSIVCLKRESDRTLIAEGRLSIDQSTNRIAENNQIVSTIVNIPDHPLKCPDSQDLLGPTLQNMTRHKGRERRGSKETIEEDQTETPLLDGEDHSETGRVVSNTENETTSLPIDSLLENEEEYHLFVCHSSEDQKVAWQIVEDLEQNGVKCMFSDRDFNIGHFIRANIENGMNRSYRILVLISSNTEIGKSGWFDMELEVAFMRFMKKKRHALIPVLLEDCKIPDTLNILSYIDGRQGVDVTADIVQELRRPGHKRKVVIDEVRDQNGIAFPVAVSKNEKLSGKVSFSSIVTQETQRQLKQMDLSIPDQVLVRTLAILNESFVVKHQHLIDTSFNVRLHFTVYVGLLLYLNLASMLHFVLCCVVPVTVTEKTSAPNLITTLVICMITMPIWFLSNRVHYIFFQRDYKEAKKDLRRKLWKEVTEQFYREKKYLLLYDDKFCLWITRYDTGPCRLNIKKYLRMVAVYVNVPDGQLEEAVDILIENIIVNYGEDVLHQLTVEQRHHKADEKCICQIVEDSMMDKGILSLSSLDLKCSSVNVV